MNLNALTFILYVLIAATTTIFVGRALYINGEVFLERIFVSMPKVIKPLNRILLLGFYLINLGFILAFFSQKNDVASGIQCLHFLITKLGIVYLLLGAMHLFNILVFMEIESSINSAHLLKYLKHKKL